MCVRYIVPDPEFFLLVEPDYSQVPPKLRLHLKQQLKVFESLTDKIDPRNLNIGYPVFGRDGKVS